MGITSITLHKICPGTKRACWCVEGHELFYCDRRHRISADVAGWLNCSGDEQRNGHRRSSNSSGRCRNYQAFIPGERYGNRNLTSPGNLATPEHNTRAIMYEIIMRSICSGFYVSFMQRCCHGITAGQRVQF